MLPRLAAALLFFALFAGCDTTDPEPQLPLSDITGTYAFTEFRFDPEAGILGEINMLDTLNTATTSLLLTDQSQFLLEYQFEGSGQLFADGDIGVDGQRVTLTPDEADEARFRALLLPSQLRLTWDEAAATLSAQQTTTVNLEAFDPVLYGGADLRNVRGNLILRLARQAQ